MRRVLPVAMLSALLAVAPTALAQRGGSVGHAASGGFHGGFAGHASFGGFHGGFAGYGGFRGGYSAPRSYGGYASSVPRFYGGAPRTLLTAPLYSMRDRGLSVYRPAYGSAYRSAYPAERGGGQGWDHRGRDRRGYGEYGGYGGYSYPFVNSWELLPWDLGYPDFTGEDDDTNAAQPASEAEPEYESAPEYGPDSAMPGDSYREDYAPYGAAAQVPIAPEPELTLFYKDGHTQQIRNYALTRDALLDLDQADSGRVARIPLASLNLPATEKAAQQAGLDFAPPAS
jgi:hypothetical protein